jgi:hypothetical protein
MYLTLEQLIKDGHIFHLENEKPNKMIKFTVDTYEEPVTIEMCPVYGFSAPIIDDLPLYVLLKKIFVKSETFIEVSDIQKMLNKEVDIIKGVMRLKTGITIIQDGFIRSVSIVGETHIQTYKSGKKTIMITIGKEC